MAKTGPKPTPAKLTQLRGNPGKRALPDPKTLVQAPVSAPDSPDHLSPEAQAEWDRILPLLVAVKLSSRLDMAMLSAYCQAYGRWVQAEVALAAMAVDGKQALTVLTGNGNVIQNPLVGLANKAAADMVRYAVELGLSPSARMRVQAGADGAPENPFEAFRSPKAA